MLFVTSGFFMSNMLLGNTAFYLGWLSLFITILPFKRIYSPNTIRIGIILIVLLLLSSLVNNDSMVVIFLMVVPILLVILYSITFTFEEIAESFVKVMVIICVISLVCFIGSIFLPSVFCRDMIYRESQSDFFYHFFYIYVKRVDSTTLRNYGMFWEPGAFQAFISLALLFVLQKPKLNIPVFIIFTLATVSTFSTTGYITYAILLLCCNKKYWTRYQRDFVYVVIAGAALVVVTYSAFLLEGESSTFGKLEQLKGDSMDNSELTSTSVRFFALIKPIEAFFQDPIFGIGYLGLQKYTDSYLHGMITCTFVNYFAIYGLLFGLIFLNGYVKCAKRISSSSFYSKVSFVVFMLIIFSENMLRNPMFIILPLFAYQNMIIHPKTIKRGQLINDKQ